MQLESSIKQPILHINYYSKTNETPTDNIYTYEHLFTHTHTHFYADKKSKLINFLAALKLLFISSDLEMHYNYATYYPNLFSLYI